MRLRILFSVAAITWFHPNLLATSCSFPPPCARVHVGSVLLVGTVIDAGVATETKDGYRREVHLQVNEIFAGLPTNTEEVVVTTDGSWLARGHSYLIDAAIGNDNHLSPSTCGTSGEVTDESIADVLDYLRRRVHGKVKTSLTVRVTDQYKPVPDVDVTLGGPEGNLRSRTGADGVATFNEIKPAKYRLTASRAHYHADTSSRSDDEVDVLAGTCPSSWVALQAEAAVSGLIRDAKGAPVAALEVELVTSPEDPSEKLSLNKPFFLATTKADGRFLFESVSPGRYLLGSNIIGQNTSSVPETYYPGQRTRNGAIPIEVKLGETADNLFFTLPDFGGSREIRVCVVDENSKPVASAGISSAFDKTGGDFARLGAKLTTDATGCIKAQGYTRVAYAMYAIIRQPEADIWQMRLSDSVVIDPGEEPALKVLILKKPIGSKKSRQ